MDVDEPESPSIHPNGRLVAFSALRNAVGDIYTVNLDTLEVTNLTNDAFADYAPTFSPDGKFLIYVSRISGNEKLFRLDLDTKKKTQLTFGTHDDTGAKFIDADTIVFSSTATNPTEPVEADVARNGNIYNIWTLNLKSGELRQYSDAVGGNVSAIVLPGDKSSRLAFVSYYKGEYSLNTLERKEPLQTASASDFGAPGLVTDFQAPLTHTVVAENKRKKGTFEKMFLDGRPPVNVGVTSGGDVFGGTQITFSDVLGDKQFNVFAASISQYRTFMGSYVNLSRRLQYAIQGYTTTQFFYGQIGGVFYDPAFSGFIDRDLAQATRTVQGGSAFAIYPSEPVPPYRGVGRPPELQRGVQRPGARGILEGVPGAGLRHDAVPQRHVDAARRRVRAGDDGVPRVRAAQGEHHAARVRGVAADRQHALAADLRRRCAATTCASAARACSRCGSAGSRASAIPPTSCTSAGTPRCAGTSTSSSSATTRCSPTPNCGSR